MGCALYCNRDYYNGLAYVRRLWKRRSNRIKGTLGIAIDRAKQFAELADRLVVAAPDLRRNKRELYRITKQRLVATSSAAVSSMLREKEQAA